MDEIAFNKCCNEALYQLLKEKVLYKNDIIKISPDYYNAIIQEFKDNELANYDYILDCFKDIGDKAWEYYHRNHYERIIDRLTAEQKRESLIERSTISAESSAKSAESSAASAKDANKISERVKIWAIIATIAAIVSAAATLFIALHN